jgi:hypothetical protein
LISIKAVAALGCYSLQRKGMAMPKDEPLCAICGQAFRNGETVVKYRTWPPAEKLCHVVCAIALSKAETQPRQLDGTKPYPAPTHYGYECLEGHSPMPTSDVSWGNAADTFECAAKSRRLLVDLQNSLEDTRRTSSATIALIAETWALIRLIDDRKA